MSSENKILEKFANWVVSQGKPWCFQKQVAIGELTADGRIVEVNENGIVKGIVAYVETKGLNTDLREILTGLGQCSYYSEQSGCAAWLVLSHPQILRLLGTQKKIDPRTSLFDIDEEKLVATEEVADRMSKSRMKRKLERTMFKSWEATFVIRTITPLAITTPKINGNGEVMLNIGQRIRGMLKLSAQTVSRSLAEACKFSVYVEPLDIVIGKKDELQMIQKFVPDSSGRSVKREFYELPAPRTIKFNVRSIHPQLTREVIENLVRQGGMFCGIGDSHTDGYHGRYELQEQG